MLHCYHRLSSTNKTPKTRSRSLSIARSSALLTRWPRYDKWQFIAGWCFFSYLPNPKTSQQISKIWGWAYWRSIFTNFWSHHLPPANSLRTWQWQQLPPSLPSPCPIAEVAILRPDVTLKSSPFKELIFLMPVNPFNLEIVEGEAHILHDLQKTAQK